MEDHRRCEQQIQSLQDQETALSDCVQGDHQAVNDIERGRNMSILT